jgi:hypothetical protein
MVNLVAGISNSTIGTQIDSTKRPSKDGGYHKIVKRSRREVSREGE